MAGFRAAAEEFERTHGPMSNNELRQFKAEWKQANGGGVATPNARPAKSPPDANAYTREAYMDAGKNASGAARGIGDWLSNAAGKVKDAVTSDPYEGLKEDAAGKRQAIGDWLGKARDHIAPTDVHENNRKEEILKRMVEHVGHKIGSLLTGDSMTEELQPEYQNMREGDPDNPMVLDDIKLSPDPSGVEQMPVEVAKARFRKGGRENPVRLGPVNLPDDRALPEGEPDGGLRTDEVTIDVPRRKVAKR